MNEPALTAYLYKYLERQNGVRERESRCRRCSRHGRIINDGYPCIPSDFITSTCRVVEAIKVLRILAVEGIIVLKMRDDI